MAHAQLETVVRYIRRLAACDAARERTDRQLLLDFSVHHDQTAFTCLVKRHGAMVLGVCQHVLRHVQDAEDAFQATFMVLARNAAAIRKREALAGWLHGVAYRTAMRAKRDLARRRFHEGRAPSRPQTKAGWELALRELQGIVDEEIQRLPAKYQAPFVLCCLESKSKAEAALELGWKVGTVSSRLAQGRKLLQQRLARRGVTLSAVLGAAALTPSGSTAALPALLVHATVKTAVLLATGKTAGAVSAEVAALVKGVSKAMFLTKIKMATLFLLAAGLAAEAGILIQRGSGAPSAAIPQLELPNPRLKANAPASAKQDARHIAPQPAMDEVSDTVTIHGIVLDPKGEPFSGAEISIWWHEGDLAWYPQTVKPHKPNILGKSGSDGRFLVSFAKAEIGDSENNGLEKPWRHGQIVAAAKGYGPAWAQTYGLQQRALTLRLAGDDMPIHGRVLDLQGRPVARARVWVDHLSAGQDHCWQNSWVGLPENVTTDLDGRFVLRGIGRDREVTLHIVGPEIEPKLVTVATHPTVNGKQVKSASLEIIAGPTKPIEGIVRAQDTGKPLAGVVIYGEEEAQRRGVRTITNEQGRYRLVGLPKAASYELSVVPQAGQNYLARVKAVADTQGLKPLAADFALRRGVPVRFRVIDKVTRKPVRRTVQYTPVMGNPYYSEATSAGHVFPSREFLRVRTPDKDGYFNFPVYPGPGFLITQAGYGSTPYPPRDGPAAGVPNLRAASGRGLHRRGWHQSPGGRPAGT